MNCDIIEKAICKRVAIYKAIGMLPPIETKDLWEENKYTKQNQNNLKPDEKDNCVTTNETKNESMRKDLKDITNQKSGIYKIVNKINGKYYIGSSLDLIRRKRTHCNELTKNIHKNYNLQKDYNKHGKNNFEFIILRKVPMSCLLILEQCFLSIHKNNPLCYNIRFNVFDMPYTGGKSLSEEHRKKLSVSHFGKKLSDDHRKKIGESNLGKKRTTQTKTKISIANKGRKLTKDQIEKMSKSRKGKYLGPKNPWYGKGHLQTGELNPSFDHTLYKWFNEDTNNIEICHRYTLTKKYNLSPSHVHRVINGKRKSHKGWTLVGVIN